MPKSSDLNDFDFSGSESSAGQRSAAFPIHGAGNGVSQSCSAVPTTGSVSGAGSGLNGPGVGVGGGVGSGCGGVSLASSGSGGGGSVTGSGSGGNGPNSGGGAGGSGSNSKKYRHQNFSKNIYIGTKNAERWDTTRQRLAFKNDVEFVTYLLNLADSDTSRNSSLPSLSATSKSFATIKLEPNLSAKDFGNSQSDNSSYLPPSRKKHGKRVQFQEALNGFVDKSKNFPSFTLKHNKKHNQHHEAQQDQSISSSLDDENIPEVLDCRIAEKIQDELEKKSANGCEKFLDDTMSTDCNKGAICLKKTNEFIKTYDRSDEEENDEEDVDEDEDDEEDVDEEDNPANSEFRIRDRSKKKHDIRKAPLNGKFDDNGPVENRNGIEKSSDNEEDYEKDDEMSDNSRLNSMTRLVQSCRECTFSHEYEKCPFRNAVNDISDCVDFTTWKDQVTDQETSVPNESNDQGNEDDNESTRSSSATNTPKRPSVFQHLSFSEASLPPQLEIRSSGADLCGIFTKIDIPGLTRLGPLIGEDVQANDIPEDCNMQYVFEIFNGSKSQFMSMENPNTSNWMRYVRIAPTYDERTVNLVNIEQKAYFVTCGDLKSGCELLYWSDECNSTWQKKYTEKTNCGGCNMKFDHPIYYRTHCSVFHDPSFSLTIRKYHCKICGEAVLGKENIMKHAAQMHDGKGAYQCQFCKKFFLRLNYLEMHRTYGCSANPQRARPLCDFCGRKFCQPQKLKVHIKRMHSDMAEVLRDFQCKLCSKLLGSRAALQRHCKEVHSRNSTVVSCPRCQKLFQNRSNLKIHMLTHSGVRPFKCAEAECTAAFTTKQCLQFHYKKVHNYTQDQMPKIERSVAYTFDAYSGGMKVDFLEQAPRRRRKSLEDQNSILSSTMMEDSKSESEYSEDNIFENIKKSGKSIKDLCRNETNLSLLSSKITSIYNKEVGKKRKRKYRASTPKESIDEEDSQDDRFEKARRKQNAQLSLVESFLSTTAQRLNAVGANVDDAQKLIGDQVELPHQQHQPQENDNNFRHIANMKDTSNHCQNLVVSKGSKKWISDDDRHIRDVGVEDVAASKMIPNRDFLARFMMNNADQSHVQHEEDENSTFLDVVDSNNPGQMSQFHEAQENQSQLHMNPITHPQSFISSFYNTTNPRLTAGGATSSASMLVEAALNSVGSMIDNEGNGIKCPNSSTLDSDSNINAQIEVDNNRFGSGMSNIESLENEIKMMKNMNNFPMQIPPLPMFQSTASNLNSCNISPDTSNNNNNSHNNANNNNNNDIDVDSSSTPRGQQISDQEKFPSHHHTPPSPQVISPGRDYTMFGTGNGGNGGTANNNISSSPLPSLQSRRSYPEHELISPASSPSIPRYDFSGEICRKRAEQQQDDRGHNNLSVQNQMSSDEENSIIAQNSTASGEEMRMKFSSTQMDLMYSKYDGVANSAIKYNNNQELDVSGFRSNAGSDISDMQGLDMTSRANIGANYHHNFQLPATTSTNLGLGRYHHHIYDILSEREQQQQQQHQQQQQQQQQQDLSMQHQSLHNMMPEQLSEQDHDQATSVDLSRTANYAVASPPALSYPHPHHDMLRMVSLDLTPNTNMAVGNNRSFLPSQIGQHNSRESLDHHRLLSTAEQHRLLAASNPEQHRLLVDPTAHLLMEQNNRLLGTDQSRLLGDSTQNRHMMSARSFGAYHQGNYHPTVRPVLPSTNHHTPNPSNYHPFPAYY